MTPGCIAPPTVGPAALPTHHHVCCQSSPVYSPTCNLHRLSTFVKFPTNRWRFFCVFFNLIFLSHLPPQVRRTITIIITSSRFSMNVLVSLNSKILKGEFQPIKPLMSQLGRWETVVPSHTLTLKVLQETYTPHTTFLLFAFPGASPLVPPRGVDVATARGGKKQPVFGAAASPVHAPSSPPASGRENSWAKHQLTQEPPTGDATRGYD